jgi:hypothetical protein
MAKIFLSYATEDTGQVTKFREAFKERGVPVWIDNEQIGYGNSIPGEINAALTECSGAVLFFSKNYVKKPWTTEERNALVYQMLEKGDFKLVVVQLEQCEIPPILKHRLWLSKDSPSSLSIFFNQWLGNVETDQKDEEISDFILVIDDRTVERLASKITEHLQLNKTNSTNDISFSTRQFGELRIKLLNPLPETLHDEIRFQLRMIGTHEFFRRDFQSKHAEGGLGIFEPAFKLQLQKKISKLENSRQELRDAVDALVAKVVKVSV